MATPGTIESFDDLLNVIGELLTEEHDRRTVIIDSLDGLEPLVWRATSARLGINSIEEAGFGKGYVEADTEWNELMAAVSALSRAGMYVVMLAHPEIVRFDSPTTDPYSRYQPKLHKRSNALVREKSDIVAFMNYRISIKEKEVARQTKVSHAEGGKERQVHFNEAAGFNAKTAIRCRTASFTAKGKALPTLPSSGRLATTMTKGTPLNGKSSSWPCSNRSHPLLRTALGCSRWRVRRLGRGPVFRRNDPCVPCRRWHQCGGPCDVADRRFAWFHRWILPPGYSSGEGLNLAVTTPQQHEEMTNGKTSQQI